MDSDVALFCRAKFAPLCKNGRAVGLEFVSWVVVALLIEKIVNAGMKGRELLQISHTAKAEHRPFSSSKWPLLVVCEHTTAGQWARIPASIATPQTSFL